MNNQLFIPGTNLSIDSTENTVSWAQLETFFGGKDSLPYKDFQKWMVGQTCTEDGVFAWDVDKYIRGDRFIID